MSQKYDAQCPHCGDVKRVALRSFFSTPLKGKKAVSCRSCNQIFVVAWKASVTVETRRN